MRVFSQFGIEVAPGSPPNVAPVGSVQLNDMAAPTPVAGATILFGRSLGGRILPASVGPSGLQSALQPHMGRNKIGYWTPIGNATTLPLADGIAAPTITGTATAKNVATSSMYAGSRRIAARSAATAGSSAGWRLAALQFFRGQDAFRGGFHLITRFGAGDAAAVADARMFVGMIGVSTAIGNVNPSTLTNIIGCGCDNAQTTLRIMHNDASGAATTIDLGANFPTNTQSLDAYELALYAAPGGSTVGWRVERLNTGNVASGTITTDIPAVDQLLAPQLWRNNGLTALAVDMDLINLYVETDN